MSGLNVNSKDTEKRIVGPLQSKTSYDHCGPQSGNPACTTKDSPDVVANKFKYIFKSINRKSKVQTWSCAWIKCKATIALAEDGTVIWASGGHTHLALSEQQIRAGFQNIESSDENVTIVTDYAAPDRLKEGHKNKPVCNTSVGICSTSAQTGATKSVPSECVSEKDVKDTTQLLETTTNEENSLKDMGSALPIIGSAFSVAKGNDVMPDSATHESEPHKSSRDEASVDRDSEPFSIKNPLGPTNDSKVERTSDKPTVRKFHSQPSKDNEKNSIVLNPKSAVLYKLSVTKNTRTMRNILGQALERLVEEGSDKPIWDIAGSSKSPRKLRTQEPEPEKEWNIEAKMEEEWHWQCVDGETAELEEDDDAEIKVDVSEQEEQDEDIDEDEMAMILGE